MTFNTGIIAIILVCWFIPILLWSIGESATDWIASTSEGIIKCRRPVVAAAGWVMLALLYPASFALLGLLVLRPIDWEISLTFFGVLSLALCVLAIKAAAPRTVILDIASGTCCETLGWTLQTKQREQALTKEARLLLCWTSNYYLLFLHTGSRGIQSRFLLTMSASKKRTERTASELADKLALPIVEGRLRQIEKL